MATPRTAGASRTAGAAVRPSKRSCAKRLLIDAQSFFSRVIVVRNPPSPARRAAPPFAPLPSRHHGRRQTSVGDVDRRRGTARVRPASGGRRRGRRRRGGAAIRQARGHGRCAALSERGQRCWVGAQRRGRTPRVLHATSGMGWRPALLVTSGDTALPVAGRLSRRPHRRPALAAVTPSSASPVAVVPSKPRGAALSAVAAVAATAVATPASRPCLMAAAPTAARAAAAAHAAACAARASATAAAARVIASVHRHADAHAVDRCAV